MKSLMKDRAFLVDRADGVYVFDQNGRRYLNATAGLWLADVGYNPREIIDIDAMHRQAERLGWFSSFGGMAKRMADRLVEVFGADSMGTVFFSNDGSEAVETALNSAPRCDSVTP